MSRITRYVLAELLKVFSVALTGLTVLIIMVGLVHQAFLYGLTLEPILRITPYILPNALLFAVPGTILFSVCAVYGRMSSSNEITALKSLGISPMAVIWPALVLAFVLSLITVGLNDVAVSWGRQGMRRVILHSVEQIAYGMLRKQKSYSTDRLSIYVREVDGKKLKQVNLTIYPQMRKNPEPILISAQEATLSLNREKNSLAVILTQSEARIDELDVFDPDTATYEIPLTDASKIGQRSSGPSEVALRRIPGEIVGQRRTIHDLRQKLAAEAAYQMVTGEFEALETDTWNGRRRELEYAQSRLHRLGAEPWRRWANGFSCLFFVMVGAPLAVRLRNADFWTSFGFCFLPILIVYYPLLMFGLDRAKSGELPPYCVWMGNLVLLAIGVWLLRKVIRY